MPKTLLIFVLGSLFASAAPVPPDETAEPLVVATSMDPVTASCIQACSARFGECLKKADQLWIDFHSNKKQIVRIINKCCMADFKKENPSPDASFATCTRVRCGSQLYGCEIKKNHSGFLSSDEVEHLESKDPHD